MNTATGNLWTFPADLRVITTNGFVKRNGNAVMGRGCALEATRRYPGIERVLGDRLAKRGNHVHLLGPSLASFPVKHAWWEEADIALIRRSARELIELLDRHTNYQRVVMPRPGCGNGRLAWADVEPEIAPLLDDRITVITF